jgi:2,3-bisphosphoglycerate-independent phosphoglycerate mutase
MSRVLLIFVDGIGLGEDDATRNIFVAEPPATMTELLDGAPITRRDQPLNARRASLVPLDAGLGVTGLPQSGTGQYTLFTGNNGAEFFGRHYGPWVPTRLRQPLQQDNLLTRARDAGLRIAFANAYPEELIDAARGAGGFHPIGPLRAGPPLVASGAGVLTRHTVALESGNAVASEIVNDGWREHLRRQQLPIISPSEAGTNLATIANENDVTLFAHYTTDYEGHRQDLQRAGIAIRRVDEFLGAVVDAIQEDVFVIVASDHGNLEDATTGHTHNPALCLIIGSDHERIANRMSSLTDIAPAIARILDGQNSTQE